MTLRALNDEYAIYNGCHHRLLYANDAFSHVIVLTVEKPPSNAEDFS